MTCTVLVSELLWKVHLLHGFVRSDLMLSAVPCSSRRLFMTSCNAFFGGTYSEINSVPRPEWSAKSSNIFRNLYNFTESCFSILGLTMDYYLTILKFVYDLLEY